MEQAAADAILAKITNSVKDICTDCDLIVDEAAIENMEIKIDIREEYRISGKEDAIFATNTSSFINHRNRVRT